MTTTHRPSPHWRSWSALGLALTFVLPLFATAADKESDTRPPLVSHAALERRLSEPNLRLIDARPRTEYEKGHISGASWVDAKAAGAIASKPDGLTNSSAWASWIEPLGIAEGTEVLIYGGKSPVDAARVWWLLRYLGVERVGLVNGGFPLWVAEGRPVSSDETKITPRPFPIRFAKGRVATKDDVLAALKSGSDQIVDARGQDEYTGARKASKRGGHVPSACRVEWSDLVDPDGRFLDEPTLRAKFQQASVKPGSPVITHCQGGGRASVDAFVLERLGFPTRNYYLGWSDWGNADDTPVTTGTQTGVKLP